MKNQRFGFTLIEFSVAILAIVILAFASAILKERMDLCHRTKTTRGEMIPWPLEGLIYTVTAVDNPAGAVIAIPHDKYYTSNTFHRVLIQVDENMRTVGTSFIRSKGRRYHRMIFCTNLYHSGWIEIAPE